MCVVTDVVAVALSSLAGIGVSHARPAGRAVEQALEQRSILVAYPAAARETVAAERLLDPLPHLGVDDGVVFALVERSLIAHLSGVEDVRQDPVQSVLGEGLASKLTAFLAGPVFGDPSPAVELLDNGHRP